MALDDPAIFKILAEMGEHFTNNINNRFIRKALLTLEIDSSSWDLIYDLVAVSDYRKTQGYRFAEMYERIMAIAKFIHKARTNVLPNLRSMLNSGNDTVFSPTSGKEDSNTRLLKGIAISNFGSNLGILADMTHNLYFKTVEIDKEQHFTKPPVFERTPELKELGKLLIAE